MNVVRDQADGMPRVVVPVLLSRTLRIRNLTIMVVGLGVTNSNTSRVSNHGRFLYQEPLPLLPPPLPPPSLPPPPRRRRRLLRLLLHPIIYLVGWCGSKGMPS